MYSNIGIWFKLKKNLLLVTICMYQEHSVHTIEMSEFSDTYFSKISGRGGIDTANSIRIDCNNFIYYIYQDGVANIYQMIEASNQKRRDVLEALEIDGL